MQQNEPINESILSDAVRQDLKKERIDHMTYLPGMEVLDSDIGQQVLTRTSSYNYHCYTEADVRRACPMKIAHWTILARCSPLLLFHF